MKRIPIALAVVLAPSLAFGQSNRPLNLGTVNFSVSITTGNAFQPILTALANRQSVTIQNNNGNGDSCWIFIGALQNGSTVATKGASILLAPGGSYQRYAPYVPNDTIQGTCTTTNDTLYIDTN